MCLYGEVKIDSIYLCTKQCISVANQKQVLVAFHKRASIVFKCHFKSTTVCTFFLIQCQTYAWTIVHFFCQFALWMFHCFSAINHCMVVIWGENKVVLHDYGSSVSRLDNQNPKRKLQSKKSTALHHGHLRNFYAPFNEY